MRLRRYADPNIRDTVFDPVGTHADRWPYRCPLCKHQPSGINDWHIDTVRVGICIMFCEKCWQKASIADKLKYAVEGYSTIELDPEGRNWAALAAYIWSQK